MGGGKCIFTPAGTCKYTGVLHSRFSFLYFLFGGTAAVRKEHIYLSLRSHYLPYHLLQQYPRSPAWPFSSPWRTCLRCNRIPIVAHFILAPPTANISECSSVRRQGPYRLNYLAMGVFEGINFYIAEKLVKDAPQVDSR